MGQCCGDFTVRFGTFFVLRSVWCMFSSGTFLYVPSRYAVKRITLRFPPISWTSPYIHIGAVVNDQSYVQDLQIKHRQIGSPEATKATNKEKHPQMCLIPFYVSKLLCMYTYIVHIITHTHIDQTKTLL